MTIAIKLTQNFAIASALNYVPQFLSILPQFWRKLSSTSTPAVHIQNNRRYRDQTSFRNKILHIWNSGLKISVWTEFSYKFQQRFRTQGSTPLTTSDPAPPEPRSTTKAPRNPRFASPSFRCPEISDHAHLILPSNVRSEENPSKSSTQDSST